MSCIGKIHLGDESACYSVSISDWDLAIPKRAVRRGKTGPRAECKTESWNQGRTDGGEMKHTATGGIAKRELEIVKLELKYCERCGGLWMREYGALQGFCGRCMVEEKQLTRLWRSRSKRHNNRRSLAVVGIERVETDAGFRPQAKHGLMAGLGSKPTMILGGLPA